MTGYRDWWNKFINQDRRGLMRLVVIGGLGVVLLGFGSFGIGKSSPQSTRHPHSAKPTQALEQQELEVAQQLSRVMDKIPGVKHVSVAVTLTRSIQSQYVNGSSGGQGTQPVVVSTNSGQTVVPFDQIGPLVGGVVIVTSAARRPAIRMELSLAAQTLLSIQAYQVLVLPT